MASDQIAVVLVHGIGDISTTSVLSSAVEGIDRSYPTERVAEPERLELAEAPALRSEQPHLTQMQLRWQGRDIRLIEFEWASVPGKIRLYRPIDALRKFLGLLTDFPLMGATAAQSSTARRVAWLIGRLNQVFLVSLLMLLAFVVLAELAGKHEAYFEAMSEIRAVKPEPVIAEPTVERTQQEGLDFADAVMPILNSDAYLAKSALTGLSIVIPVYGSLVALVAAIGLGLHLVTRLSIRPVLALALGCVVSTSLLLVVQLAAAIASSTLFFMGLDLLHIQEGAFTAATTLFTPLILLVFSWLLLKPAALLGNLVRDVVHYLAPDVNGDPQPHQEATLRSLEALFEDLRRLGVGHIVLVTHSLGTVIAAEALSRGERSAADAERRVEVDFVTAGSPIRRLIHRMLPARIPEPSALRRRLRENPRYPVARWLNAYRVGDYVGQALIASPLLERAGFRRQPRDAESGIRDVVLTPWLRWPFGHANYWRDRRFVDLVAQDVLGPLLLADGSRRDLAGRGVR